MNLEGRIIRSISLRPGLVVLYSDFVHMGSPSQVGRVLSDLVAKGKLVRVSKGAFAKTRINKFTGKPTPAGTLESIAEELFRKLRIDIRPGRLIAEYNAGKTTQIPMTATINTGNRRIIRKITVGNRSIQYERNR